MRILAALVLWLVPHGLLAQDWEDRQMFASPGATQILRVISSTDTSLFGPVIQSFIAANPTISIEYLVHGTTDIDKIFRAHPDNFDVIISSAMDLQLRTANDGYALRLDNITHPPWAQWRQNLFAFTAEPAAIIVNRAAFEGFAIPTTRQELIESIRTRPDFFRGRIGTYDIRQSGLGYLFATQDARASETYWRLMQVMGALDVRLYCCSGTMIDDVSDGTIAVAYNVLGSYATARTASQDTIRTILPSDFPTMMMRTAMVSAEGANRDIAVKFLQHVLTLGETLHLDAFPLPLLDKDTGNTEQAVIPLEPALMTFLDALKRQQFLSEWEDAVIQE